MFTSRKYDVKEILEVLSEFGMECLKDENYKAANALEQAYQIVASYQNAKVASTLCYNTNGLCEEDKCFC